MAKAGDFVRIEFIGRVTKTNKIFDATDKELAKKSGLFDGQRNYGPQLVILGKGQLLPGLEREIYSLGPGEEKEFMLEAKEAFGPRRRDAVRVLSLAEFRKREINPAPGQIVALDNRLARVKSVSSGRVVVDFNHPLAGEKVSYWLKLNALLPTPEEKAAALLQAAGLAGKITLAEKEKMLKVKGRAGEKKEHALRFFNFQQNVRRFLPGFEKAEWEEEA